VAGAERESTAELRERLRDAEALSLALQRGEVDAFVVGKSEEDKRVLFLSAAYAGYRRLVDEMSDGALTLSPAGEVLYANPAFAALVGATRIDPLRARVEDYVALEDRPRLASLLRPAASGETVDARLVREDGSDLAVRLSVVVASDEFVTLRVAREAGEVEEARAVLEAIRQGGVDGFVIGGEQVVLLDSAQTPYRVLVERMRQGAVTTQVNGTIVYVNDRFASMVGSAPRALLGGNVVDHVDPLDQAAFRAFLAKTAHAQIEVRLRAVDRGRRTVLVGMTPLGGHRLFLVSDITERKRHAAAEELNRRFLGLLAEEFTDLIRPIDAAVDTMRGLHADAKTAAVLDGIRRQTARLQALVEDLRRINPKE
jgi:PAS domain S-box-containing protein